MKIKLFTIPNLLTLSNLLCGSFAVVAALVYGNLTLAFQLIILGAVFDFFDGFAARLLKCPSPIGVELDSLADMVSFGFAPAAMFFTMYAEAPQLWAWSDGALAAGRFALFIMTAFSALRLAKFNIDDTQHTEFCGLTTTANAMFCASVGWLTATGRLALPVEAILLLAVAMSLLMVSPIRMFALKFQGFGWKDNSLRYIFILLAALLVVLLGGLAIPVAILLYIAISLVRWFAGRTRSGKA